MAASLGRSRDEVQENETKFRELAEAIREVFWVAAPDGTKVHYVIPAYEEVWGGPGKRSTRSSILYGGNCSEDRPARWLALENMTTAGLDEEYRIRAPRWHDAVDPRPRICRAR